MNIAPSSRHRNPLQVPVGPDGEAVIGPDGKPLFVPHFQVPAWMVFGNCSARELGAYGFLHAFVNQGSGEVQTSVTAADIAKRFNVSEQTISRKGGRKNNPAGLVQRLEEAQALWIVPQVKKTRDCDSCNTPAALPCPKECTETKGRIRLKPRFRLATHPPHGFLYQGPMNRWEYHNPKKIAKRLREEGPDSTLPPQNRRQVVPFVQAMAWVAFYSLVGLEELGVYLFICGYISLNDGVLTTEDLYRAVIARRFGKSQAWVSEITRRLERVGVIAKSGLVTSRSGRRYGTREATGYVVRVLPPTGLVHPMPMHVGEWRDPSKITRRQEAVRSNPEPLQFPHTPSGLRIVDNSSYPQGGGCGTWRGGMWNLEGGDVEPGDLNTNPSTDPQDKPLRPSAGEQPQGEPSGTDGRTDEKTTLEEDGGGAGSPSARPAPSSDGSAGGGEDPVSLEVIRNAIPAAVLQRGEADQRALAHAADRVLSWGFSLEDVRTLCEGLDQVAWPFAVLMERLSSRSRVQAQLDRSYRSGRSQRRLCGFPVWGDDDLPSPPEFPVSSEGTALYTCPDHPTVWNRPGGHCAVCGRECRRYPNQVMPDVQRTPEGPQSNPGSEAKLPPFLGSSQAPQEPHGPSEAHSSPPPARKPQPYDPGFNYETHAEILAGWGRAPEEVQADLKHLGCPPERIDQIMRGLQVKI